MSSEARGGGGVRPRLEVVREFVSALVDAETYRPRKNPYVIFGLLWGLPVPVLGILFYHQIALAQGYPWSVSWLMAHGLMWVLCLHPPLFAVVFGAMGTVRSRKTRRIEGLLKDVEAEMKHIQEAHDELQKMARLKDEFVGNVTHELKTPIVTIRGYSEMLAHGRLGKLEEAQRHALEVMLRNCARLQAQVEQLLSAGRNQADLTRIKVEDADLGRLAREVMEHHLPVAKGKGVRLECSPPAPNVTLRGDYVRLMEVLDNLLSNAIKFTESGGRVELRFGVPRGARIPVEVVDTGCGIAPEAQDVIFERFRQADGSIRRRYGGSGLGLAVVRENLSAHGCSIGVDSRPGGGSRFFFELPLRE